MSLTAKELHIIRRFIPETFSPPDLPSDITKSLQQLNIEEQFLSVHHATAKAKWEEQVALQKLAREKFNAMMEDSATSATSGTNPTSETSETTIGTMDKDAKSSESFRDTLA